jgi:hypothetical protein
MAVQQLRWPRPSVGETRAQPATTNASLPDWVQAADFGCLALVLIALTVFVSGGFRIVVAARRISLTSPVRPLLLAALIAAARHLAIGRPPIHAHVIGRVTRWSRSTALRAATTVFLGTRPMIFFVGLMAVVMFGYVGGGPPWRDYDNEFFNLPLRWDAGWYLQIAERGYGFIQHASPELQQNIVFFPAYPVITRLVALLLGNQKSMYVVAATIVSLGAFLFALVYLYVFARELLDADRAMIALWLLAAYPFALFYGAIYSESLYLLAALGAFHHFRRSELVRAGAWGFLVGLTRPNGAFLSVPLALWAISPMLPLKLAGGNRQHRTDTAARAIVLSLATAAMCGLGTLIYSAFIWRLTGDPFAWVTGHAAWGRRYQGVVHLVIDRYRFIEHEGLYNYVVQLPYDLLNTLATAFVLVSVWPVWRRWGIAFAAFILINVLPPLAMGGLLSAGRVSAVIFPAFIWLAAALPARHRLGWLIGFSVLQALNAALFYTWRPLY